MFLTSSHQENTTVTFTLLWWNSLATISPFFGPPSLPSPLARSRILTFIRRSLSESCFSVRTLACLAMQMLRFSLFRSLSLSLSSHFYLLFSSSLAFLLSSVPLRKCMMLATFTEISSPYPPPPIWFCFVLSLSLYPLPRSSHSSPQRAILWWVAHEVVILDQWSSLTTVYQSDTQMFVISFFVFLTVKNNGDLLKEKKVARWVGSRRYMSLNTHYRVRSCPSFVSLALLLPSIHLSQKDQSRRDDLYSLLYVLVEFRTGRALVLHIHWIHR